MGKKRKSSKKKNVQVSWCWYCDREFEDDKVLLQHQKAKHFRCPHCPRRLNTAGGLAVHIDQVHKLGTDKIENALPGRDTFDVEIYGMEGIPAEDLDEWKKRRADETGMSLSEQKPKRPKIDKSPLTTEEAIRLLAEHRAIMSQNRKKAKIQESVEPLPAPPAGQQPMPTVPPPVSGAPVANLPRPPNLPAHLPWPPPPGFTLPPPPPGGPGGIPPLQKDLVPQAIVPQPHTIKQGQSLLVGDSELSIEERRSKRMQYHMFELPPPSLQPPPTSFPPPPPNALPFPPPQGLPPVSLPTNPNMPIPPPPTTTTG